MQIQSGITRKPAYDKSHYQQEMAKAKAQQQMLYPGLYQRTNNTTTTGNRGAAAGSMQQLQQQQEQLMELNQQVDMLTSQLQRLMQSLEEPSPMPEGL